MALLVIGIAIICLGAGAKADCTHNSQTYADQAEWSEGCHNYKCEGSQWTYTNNRCTFGPHCVDAGNTQDYGCSTYLCHNRSSYEITVPRCSIGGECKEVSTTTHYGCIWCYKKDNNEPYTEGQCQNAGQCYDLGHEMMIGCKDMVCKNDNNVWGFKEVDGGTQRCSFSSGCVDAGTMDENCLTCSEDGTPGRQCKFQSTPTTTTCGPDGHTGTHYMSGTAYTCTCSVNGLHAGFHSCQT